MAKGKSDRRQIEQGEDSFKVQLRRVVGPKCLGQGQGQVPDIPEQYCRLDTRQVSHRMNQDFNPKEYLGRLRAQ